MNFEILKMNYAKYVTVNGLSDCDADIHAGTDLTTNVSDCDADIHAGTDLTTNVTVMLIYMLELT